MQFLFLNLNKTKCTWDSIENLYCFERPLAANVWGSITSIAAKFDELSSFWRFCASKISYWWYWRFMLLFWRFLETKNVHHILYFSTLKASLELYICIIVVTYIRPLIGLYKASVRITTQLLHTTHVVCINCIREWRNLHFNVDSER